MTQSSPAPSLNLGSISASRRSMLRGALLGAGAFAVPAALAGCDNSSSPSSGGTDSANKTVSFGSNYSDDVPKKAFADTIASSRATRATPRRSTRSTTTPSRRTSTATSRATRTTCSPGSPASACSTSPRRASPMTSTTCGRDIGADYSAGLRDGLDRQGRQAVLRAVLQLPVGGVLPEERLGGQGLPVPKTIDDLKTLGAKMKNDGLYPDRVRATRTAGRRWAPSTTSTCGSTATTSTSS